MIRLACASSIIIASASYLSGEIVPNSSLFSALVWMRNEAVSTNCPTVAENPDRKALKGYQLVSHYPSSNTLCYAIRSSTYVVSNYNTVHKLQHSNHHQESHERINELRPLRRLIHIFLPYRVQDLAGVEALIFLFRFCGSYGSLRDWCYRVLSRGL